MKNLDTFSAAYLKDNMESLSDKIIKFCIKENINDRTKLNPRNMDMLKSGVMAHLKSLQQSLSFSEKSIYENSVKWAKEYIAGIKIPLEAVMLVLKASEEVINENLPEDLRANIIEYIETGISLLQKKISQEQPYIKKGNKLYKESLKYMEYLKIKDRSSALKLVLNLINSGCSIKDIYLSILQPVQNEMGRIWQKGEITSAHEHYATAVTQLVMSQLYSYIFKKDKGSNYFLAACVEGEFHEIGLRMISDLLELEGWTTFYLGANTGIERIKSVIAENKINIIGLSVTIAYNLDNSRKFIENIKSISGCQDIKIIIGGYVLNNSPGLWKKTGADCYARDVDEAINVISNLSI